MNPWHTFLGGLGIGFITALALPAERRDRIPREECQSLIRVLRQEWAEACEDRERTAHQAGLAVCDRGDP